jgi:hypothetical protein
VDLDFLHQKVHIFLISGHSSLVDHFDGELFSVVIDKSAQVDFAAESLAQNVFFVVLILVDPDAALVVAPAVLADHVRRRMFGMQDL